MINAVVTFLVFLTLAASIGFVSVYATGPWKVSNLGRATMTWGTSMIIWCCAGLAYSFYGATWYYPWLRLIAYAATSWAMWTMLVTLIGVRRAACPQDDEDKLPVS